MLELITTVASVGIGAIATFAWIEQHHGLALMLFGLSLWLGLSSIRSICGI
jgi:hypothetical protein